MTNEQINHILSTVTDPEIPVLTILDMGIVREITAESTGINISITPTYSGCPAMNTIADDICAAFAKEGVKNVSVKLVLSPAWSTDWLSEEGKQKLSAYGIAPPLDHDADKAALWNGAKVIPCPQCHSTNTKMISMFGSTACKSLHQCNDCLETFDYFKCLK
jgi:ring-1,2-phenylacetyl-CoA epoxidase subunit PaaD